MSSTDTDERAARPNDASSSERPVATADGRTSGRRNRNLQWLRAFAALSVVLYHASVYLDRFVGDDRFLRLFDGRFGLLGVAIFFAISGYLMAEILPRTDPWSFLTHRIVRIYPIFLIVLGILLGRAVSGNWIDMGDFIVSFVVRAWYVIPLIALAVFIEWRSRPTLATPRPSGLAYTTLPSLAYITFVVVAVILSTPVPPPVPR